MNQADREKKLPADPELDAVLDQMAGEVPPMPADFHDKWMNAIRAEAKQDAPAAEEKTEKKPVSPVRWTRMLSIAATFVFLIGGTILYRNSRQPLTPVFRAEKKEAAAMTAAAPAAQEEAADLEEMPEEKPETLRKDADITALAGGSLQAAPEAAVNSWLAETAVDDEEPLMAEAAEAVYDAAEEPMPLPQATAMPTMPAFEAEPATEETDMGEKAEEDPGLLRQAGDFIADMGDFLLAALPYLAVLAVPAVIAAVLRGRKKNR